MINKEIIKKIDKTIKEIWQDEIITDYDNGCLLKEDSLKCSLYFHLRTKLAPLLDKYNLRIYPEYYFPTLNYFADIAIVKLDSSADTKYLKDKVTDIIAIMELKFDGGNSLAVKTAIKGDIAKIKNYIQHGQLLCQYYLVTIYETECSHLNWIDKRSSNHWAKGYVTELNAGYINDEMWFEVNSYNDMN